ncbi:MAG TPA: hypothetical protein PKA82_01970 [Pyrinomonadaceae bacterium]|nr:hypothetical protein [Pyrinomonadaceae bacterium]
MNIRPRTAKAKTGVPRFAIAGVVITVLVGVAATLGFDWYSGKLGIVGPHFEIEQTATGKVIKVPPGGNINAAIAKATSGDIIELQAGATYVGEIKLPKKDLTDFITIRTSAHAQLTPDVRVSPKDAPLLAKIVTRTAYPAISAANGAHHYRFVGVEVFPDTKTFIYNLISFGSNETAANIPHSLEIDRSYIHDSDKGISRRGIALNSGDTVIKNSYVEGFAGPNEETQGICGWSGTRNVSIINNYIEGGAENIMFGGSDPQSPDLIPRDIEVRGNHLSKPEAWKTGVTVKTLFELKNAKNVKFIGNLLENNWKGPAFRITVRNQDGRAPFSTIENVDIRDNVVRNIADGINILGRDDGEKSGTLKNLVIENNLFLDLREGPGMEGGGYFIQAASGENVTISNNTVFNSGNITTFYGEIPVGFVFRDNIVGHGNYGIHGPIDMKAESTRSMFTNNLIMNLNGVPTSDYAFPGGNTMIQTSREIGFVDLAGGDFRLSANSKFRGKGRNGRDHGAALPPLK